MNVILRKIGNSEGIIIPKDVVDQLGVQAGDVLDMTVSGASVALSVPGETFNRQLDHARAFMDKYKVALKKLAE